MKIISNIDLSDIKNNNSEIIHESEIKKKAYELYKMLNKL